MLGLSVVASLVAYLVHFPWGKWLLAPAMFVTGWAAMGHFVTLDDELPGGWSNPQGSKVVWYGSVAEFLVKATIFAGLVWLFTRDWAK